MPQLFKLLILALFFADLTNGSVSMHNPFYCYAEPIRPQQSLFAFHTAYESSRGHTIDPNVSQCAPSRFWLFIRHGTRFLQTGDLSRLFEHGERLHREILENYDSGRSSLCASDIQLIRNWKLDPNMTFDNADELTVAGWGESRQLAERYQSAFPTLLPSEYSRNHYFFRSGAVQRTRDTLRGFADGLFGYDGHQQVEFGDVAVPDLLVRPYMFCPLNMDLIDSSQTRVEQRAYFEGPEYQEMISRVSRKLGFPVSRTLRVEEIDTLRTLCRFEQIWDMNATAPFCAAFSVADHQILEYWYDLYYYHAFSYGMPYYRTLRENMQCSIIQDMLTFLRSNDPTDQTARIFGGHSPGLSLIFTSLGVFEDEVPLNQHNFAQQIFRLYKSSTILPFAANLAVIRYE